MSKKILVTGSRGFLGRNLIKKLGMNYEVLYNDNCNDLDKSWDSMNPEVDFIYNFAAMNGGIGWIKKNGSKVITNNVSINKNLIDFSIKNKIKRVFFSSSACVYPEHLQDDSSKILKLQENMAIPANPDTAYGWEKIFSERMLLENTGNFDVRIGRMFSVFGPGMPYNNGKEKSLAALLRKVIISFINKKNPYYDVEIWGDGKQLRNFIYIDDAINAITRVMGANYAEPINIGSDELISIDDIVTYAEDYLGFKANRIYNKNKPVGVKARDCDNTLLKEKTGWKQKISMKKGIGRCIDWMMTDMIHE